MAGYPRLAGLLEASVARVQRDSAARDVGPALDDGQVRCGHGWQPLLRRCGQRCRRREARGSGSARQRSWLPPTDPPPRPPSTTTQADALLECAADFQAAYLAAALGRLSEAAAAAFPGSVRALPTAADLQKAIARVHEELKAAAGGVGWLAGCPAGCGLAWLQAAGAGASAASRSRSGPRAGRPSHVAPAAPLWQLAHAPPCARAPLLHPQARRGWRSRWRALWGRPWR